MMLTLPNFITLSRIPLAFLFLKQEIAYRAIALLLAMISDSLDGFIARRYRLSSPFGTFLDPLTDRFFVFFIVAVFIGEGKLTLLQASTLFCRDFSVFLFGIYLFITRKISSYKLRAILCGKITTFFQFLLLLSLTFSIVVPSYFYAIFVILGFFALIELYVSREDVPDYP